MHFRNTVGRSKAIKVVGGVEVLRPSETREIEGKFDKSYLDHLETLGIMSSDKEFPEEKTEEEKTPPKKKASAK